MSDTSIATNEYRQFIRRALKLGGAEEVRLLLIFAGGSDRVFYRVRRGNGASFVFMHYQSSREENMHYAAIAEFLRSRGIAVPGIIGHDAARGFILMEDLGERDLWSFRGAPWEERRVLYRKTLDLVRKLHALTPGDIPGKAVPLMEAFSPDLYRWERDYFLRHFVEGICGIHLGPGDAGKLEQELAALAGRVDAAARNLIHRDLQSRNVMISGGEPALIDFQGMRFGSLLYDLGSLLYDPYVSFTDEEQLDLLSYYYRFSGQTLNWEKFQSAFREASAQRLMQALGAYGFLGVKRGLKDFLGHIPRGLDDLIDAARRSEDLPRLRDLVALCREKIAK